MLCSARLNLGPILYLIYINDFDNVCKHTIQLIYAGNTNLFINDENYRR